MNEFETTITGGGLVTLLIEALKFIWRKWIIKNPEYDFPVLFYVIAIPVLNALAPFALFYLGIATDDPILGFSAAEIVQYLIRLVIASLVSLVTYGTAIKPLKVYGAMLYARKHLLDK